VYCEVTVWLDELKMIWKQAATSFRYYQGTILEWLRKSMKTSTRIQVSWWRFELRSLCKSYPSDVEFLPHRTSLINANQILFEGDSHCLMYASCEDCLGKMYSFIMLKQLVYVVTTVKDLRFSQRRLWIMLSSGRLCRVALVRTDILDECMATITRVAKIGELGTM
jgi:hypothetical protein